MWKFLSQQMRGTSFDFACDVCGQGIGIGPQKQMDMIGLYRQGEQLPGVFFDHLLNDLLQSLMNRPNQHLPPSFRAPNKMIDHQVDAMAFMLIFHVDSLLPINGENKHLFSASQ